MTRIAIGNLSFNTDDFSEDLQAAVDLLLEVYLKEKTGRQVICISSSPTDKMSEFFHPDHSFPNEIQDVISFSENEDFIRTTHDWDDYAPKIDFSDFDSYVPRICLNKFLWFDPKIFHSREKVRPGYHNLKFHRKCHMQSKTGVNHRRAGKR